MGIFDFFKGSQNNNFEHLKEFPKFVTDEESEGLDKTISYQLDDMKTKLNNIKENIDLKDEAVKLEDEITKLIELIRLKKSEKSFAIKIKFDDIKRSFDILSVKNDRAISLEKLLSLNNDLKEKLNKPFGHYDSKIGYAYLNNYFEAIKGVQEMERTSREKEKALMGEKFDRIDLLAQDFHKASYEAEYRICMLQMAIEMEQLDYSDKQIQNPFQEFDTTRKNMFLKFFNVDLAEAIEKYNTFVLKNEKLIKKKRVSLWNELDGNIKKFDNILGIQVCQNPELKGIISGDKKNDSDSFFDVTLLLLKIKRDINQMKADFNIIFNESLEEMQKESEKQAKEQAEKEKAEKEQAEKEKQKMQYATFSNAEIETKLKQIRDNISIDSSSSSSQFVDMLDFQIEVAIAKNLLPEDVHNPQYGKSANILDAYRLLSNVNKSGTPCFIFPDGQEYGDGEFSFVVPKENKDVLDLKPIPQEHISKSFKVFAANSEVAKHPDNKYIGELPDFLLDMFYSFLIHKERIETIDKFLKIVPNDKTGIYKILVNERYLDYPTGTYRYSSNTFVQNSKECFKSVLDTLKSMDGNTNQLKNILAYIYLPANMNMIPLLEKLKEAKVDYYIEPLPEGKRNTLNRNHIHIYYRREQNDVVDEVVNQLYTAYNCNIDTRWSSEKSILFGKRLVQEINKDDLSRD